MVTMIGLVWAKAKTQELEPDLPLGWQGYKDFDHLIFHNLFNHNKCKPYQKQSSQNLKLCSSVGSGCCAKILARTMEFIKSKGKKGKTIGKKVSKSRGLGEYCQVNVNIGDIPKEGNVLEVLKLSERHGYKYPRSSMNSIEDLLKETYSQVS